MNSNHFNKLKTYIGFAIKSRKIKYGTDDIIKLKKADIILVSSDLAESSLNNIEKFVLKTNAPMYILDSNDFHNILGENVKVIAILDDNLAGAIKFILTNEN